MRNLFNSTGFEKSVVRGVGIFEAFYITTYFSLKKPEILLRLLDGFILNKTDSVWGKILQNFAEMAEKIDILGLYIIGHSNTAKLS